MKKDNIHNTSAGHNKRTENKQIQMSVDGCTVKLNFLGNQEGAAKIEAVKRMILNGLAKV